MLNVPDHQVKLAAVGAGVGIAVMPERWVPSHLVKAKEYYLPPLPPIKIMLCARLGLQTELASTIMKQLSALFFPRILNPAKSARQRAEP
jgi:DNA-binding transcriptional LysR family regulator